MIFAASRLIPGGKFMIDGFESLHCVARGPSASGRNAFIPFPGTCSSARHAPRRPCRATISRPWRDSRHPAPRRVSAFILCRGGAITEAHQGFRATGLHRGAVSLQHSVRKPNPKVSPRSRGGAEKGKGIARATAEGGCATQVSATLQQMKRAITFPLTANKK